MPDFCHFLKGIRVMKYVLFSLALIFALGLPAHAAPNRPAVVSINDVSCVEGRGCAFTITKTKVAQPTALQIDTFDDTAKAGVDYTARSYRTTLAGGTGATSYTVATMNNETWQGSRRFGVRVSVLSNGSASKSLGYGSIGEDDAQPEPTPPSTGSLPASEATKFTTAPGLPDVPSEFDTALLLQGGWSQTPGAIPQSMAPDVVGAFRFDCAPGQILYDDPIVYPGQPGKSHLHQFFGNTTANANSTYDSLRRAGSSTCEDHPGIPGVAINRSAYWIPAMLDGKGNVVKPTFVTIYYKRRPQSDAACKFNGGVGLGDCVPLPNGLRFIAGWNAVTGKQEGDAYFDCQGQTAKPGRYANLEVALANCPTAQNPDGSYNMVGAVIGMPNCWDGVNLDSPDHHSHMSYIATWEHCPATHPKTVPTFLLAAWYTLGPGLDQLRLASDVMAPGAPRGSTLHGDWFGAWDNQIEAVWTDNCINKMLSCTGGEIGNGKQIVGGWVRPIPDAERIVPVPPMPAMPGM